MSKPNWLHPASPLLAFASALGIPEKTLREGERQADLPYNDKAFPVERGSAVTLDLLVLLEQTYGEALTLRFLVGDLPVLTLATGLRQAALDDFRKGIADQTHIEVDLRLNKTRLLLDWIAEPAYATLLLFLFPEALMRALSVPFPELEHGLLATSDNSRKTVLLVPEDDIALDGEYLAILGGAAMDRWETYLPRTSPNTARVAEIYAQAVKHLKWVYFSLERLTPTHLMVSGTAHANDPIALAFFRQLVAFSIAYTADQTKMTESGWSATFAAGSYVAEVTIGDVDAFKTVLGEVTGADDSWLLPRTLAGLAEWSYLGGRGASDRLGVMQGVVAHTLQGNDPLINYRELIRLAGHLHQEVEWGWGAFIEDKLNVYFSRLRDLETTVDATVKSFDEQSQSVIKSLSDSVLAAVGVIIGSFIGALFKDSFNAVIFRLGLLLYAMYVFIFPACVGLLAAWQRFNSVVTNFNKRKTEFAKRLFPEKVDAIVGTTVDDAARYFKRWFISVIIAYAIVIAFLLTAATVIPSLMPPPITLTPTPINTLPLIDVTRTPSVP